MNDNDNKKNTAFKKMSLLAAVMQEVEQHAKDELNHAAFEVLLLNPGYSFCEWSNKLINDYATEVEDVYGNPDNLLSKLSDLWLSPYKDTASGLEYTFASWAQCFHTKLSVQMYYDFIEKLKK